MSTPRPLMLATLGVLIVTIAQGCSFPQVLPQKEVNYGILKLDPKIDREEFKGKFGTVNTIVNADGSSTNTDLANTTITSISQFKENDLFALSSSGIIYNTDNGGVAWRQIKAADNFTAQYIDYAKDDDEKIIISGSLGGTGKIYLSTNEGQLTQIYSDVPGGTSIPYVFLSKRNNDQIIAVVRNNAGDELISSSDGGKSWQKYEKLTSRVRAWNIEDKQLVFLSENNEVKKQSNTNDSSPIFDVEKPVAEFQNQTINKVIYTTGTSFVLTNAGLYRKSSEGAIGKISLPITDAPVISMAVDPFDSSHYVAGVGTKLLETKNGGSSWTVRNDVGTEIGAGRVLVTHFDPFQQGQIFLGRGK